ncbi:RelA/SpoT domain-containing protein [Anabaena sp. CCY 9910]|uniref:RelA/SpoT domain-containing protein n=1 Tax=Anabaena sp. CCY 9910 TaxID=3103870 RepID=UPI0039DF4988
MSIKLSYSKKQVRKAGECLINKHQSMPTDEALLILNNWRLCHAYPLNSVQNSLRYRAKLIDDKAVVTQRLKRISSIKNKLIRFDYMKLDTMQDIGGCRVILPNNNNVYQVKEEIINTKSINIIKEVDYILNPKVTGYRGIHLISQYCGKNLDFKDLKIEIQIRNKMQHYWATAVEIIDTFTGQHLKSGEEENEWHEFFKLVGLSMGKIENEIEIENSDKEKIKQLNEKLEVTGKLLHYRNLINWTENIGKVKGIFLLILNPKINEIKIVHFRNSELVEATEEYARLEKETQNENIDIVLIKTDSIEEIKKGYPNYFADSENFIEILFSILDMKE